MTSPYWQDEETGLALYLGDMRDVLPTLNITADLIIADPPYEETSHHWDRWPDGWLDTAATVSRSMWCFGGLRMFMRYAPQFTAAGWRLSHDTIGKDDTDVVWEKHNASGPNSDRFRRVHEQAGLFYQGAWRDVYRQAQRVTTGVIERGRVIGNGSKSISHRGTYADNGWTDDGTRLMTSVIKARSMHRNGGIHPTEKPVPLLLPLIRYGCPPGGLVVDPFGGSCSTLLAARQAGVRAVAVEGHEPHAEAAARRLSEPYMTGLFDQTCA